MPKRKCRCKELREEAERYRLRLALVQGQLRRLVELEDEQRAFSREYERAVIDARGLLRDVGADR